MTVRFLIGGVVQGVGFRYFVARRAGALGLYGWARNLADGRVEVVVQGAATDIRSLEADLNEGPPRSRVSTVHRSEISDETVSSKTFTVN